MTDEPDNIILQYLRRFDERQTSFEDAMQDLKVRMSSIAAQLTALRADVTHVPHRIDRVDERLLRIERRLDLVEAVGPATPMAVLDERTIAAQPGTAAHNKGSAARGRLNETPAQSRLRGACALRVVLVPVAAL